MAPSSSLIKSVPLLGWPFIPNLMCWANVGDLQCWGPETKKSWSLLWRRFEFIQKGRALYKGVMGVQEAQMKHWEHTASVHLGRRVGEGAPKGRDGGLWCGG